MPLLQVMGARTWKNPVLALLAANTAVSMTQTDGFLSTKLFNEYYGQFTHRIDTVIGGTPSIFTEKQKDMRKCLFFC